MAHVIDQLNCSGCHRCRMECPANAIRFKNDKYWIDHEKCVSCGACAAVCHNGCISNPDAPKKAIQTHDTLHLDCDVCVIGAGGAGMVAAAKAQDLGARVVVLEKNHEIGGSAWYATGFSVHYSKWHKAAGKPDNREKTYQEFLQKTAGHDVDPVLLKRLFDANADWIDWMIDQHRLEELYSFNSKGFGPMCLTKKVFPEWNDRRIDNMIGPGGGGWLITTTLLKDFTEKGGRVLCSTPARELKTNERGEITGVVAEDAGGIIELSCKAVVVASGAFTRSREIMNKMQPLFFDDEGKQPIHIFTCSTCTGDGITMCEKIGADVDYVNRRVNMFGPMRHPYPGVTLNVGDGPMFHTTGKRYQGGTMMQEVSDLAHDPKRYLWKIVDEAGIVKNMDFKIAQGTDAVGVDLSHFLKNWRSIIAEEIEAGAVVKADTLEELAGKLDYDPAQLISDINAYNASLSKPQMPAMMLEMMGGAPDDMASPEAPPAGEDMDALMAMMASMLGLPAQPVAQGPFYAVKMSLFHENAMGGMVIDQNTNVTRDGQPIPGLFAAGDTTRGIMIPGDLGVSYIEGVFTALTYAFNSGYLSGTEAANYALRS